MSGLIKRIKREIDEEDAEGIYNILVIIKIPFFLIVVMLALVAKIIDMINWSRMNNNKKNLKEKP